MLKHIEFLTYVEHYVRQHPEVAAYIQGHVVDALIESRSEVLERASVMEALLSMALNKQTKKQSAFIAENLRKFRGKSSLLWDSQIEALEAMK